MLIQRSLEKDRRTLLYFTNIKMWMATVFVLFCDIFAHTTGAMILMPSRTEHDGSVAIVGANRTSRSSPVDAAISCLYTADCRGIWFHDDGSHGISQAGVCHAEPYKLNSIMTQTEFYFTVMEQLEKGDSFNYSDVTHRGLSWWWWWWRWWWWWWWSPPPWFPHFF